MSLIDIRKFINKLKTILSFGLILSFLSVTACLDDVPHDNPLDSKNKNQGITLSGKVSTFYAPVQPIANAVISLFPEDKKFFSNSNGEFEISGLEPGIYSVLCNAYGFASDSIALEMDSNMNIDFFLDGLPFFENIELTTHHVLRSFPVEDMFSIKIKTRVNDFDGIADISHVLYDIPEFAVTDTLDPSLDIGLFQKLIGIDDLPVNTIQTLIGRAFILSVSDDAGVTIESGKRFLTRVIEETPLLIQPIFFQTVSSDSIPFSWEKFSLPFSFSFKIEIFHINEDFSSTRVLETEDISGIIENTILTTDLPSGDYFWILTVVDEYGNTSSSKEATFHIN